jgi:hypothetical protein
VKFFTYFKALIFTTLILTHSSIFAAIPAQPTSLAKNTFGIAKDAAITTYLYAKLAAHPELSKVNIDISTHDSVVTLNGVVNSSQIVMTIVKLAESIAGVKSVDASNMIIGQPNKHLYIETANEEPMLDSIQSNPIAASQPQQPSIQATAPAISPIHKIGRHYEVLKIVFNHKTKTATHAFKNNKQARNHLIHKKISQKKRTFNTTASKKTRSHLHVHAATKKKNTAVTLKKKWGSSSAPRAVML